MEPGADYPVRPTRLCLEQLGYTVGQPGFPPLTRALHALDDGVVERVQQMPEELAAGGAEKIRCLEDRAWFEVRSTERMRGAATRLTDGELRAALGLAPDAVPGPTGRWWLGAAGWHEEGSPADFYAVLEKTARREAAGDHKHDATSRWLMPGAWDWDRLTGEAAWAWVDIVQRDVRKLVALSITSGDTYGMTLRDHIVEVTVRADGQQGSFLAIAAEGIYDPLHWRALLTSVRGIKRDDWMDEPDGFAGITPRSGQLVYSTLLSPEQAAGVLALHED